MRQKKNYGRLDFFRIAAAILVITIHTSPLAVLTESGDFFLTRVLARVAVPFFFMVTGCFTLSDNSGPASLLPCLKKLCLLYGAAILLYLPLGIYAGHYSELSFGGLLRMIFFDGTFYHLWYFPACILGIILVSLLSLFLSLKGMTVVSSVLYVIGLFGDSYFGLIEKLPVVGKVYEGMFHVFSYTRNGFFLAPVFLVMGMWCGRLIHGDGQNDGYSRYVRSRQPGPRTLQPGPHQLTQDSSSLFQETWFLAVCLAVSFLLMTVEAFVLRHFKLQRHDSMYIFLIPVMFFLYRLLLTASLPSQKSLRTVSTWIYLLHPAMIVVVRGAAKVLHLTGLLVENQLVHFLAVTVLSVAAGFVLTWLISLISARFSREKYLYEPPRASVPAKAQPNIQKIVAEKPKRGKASVAENEEEEPLTDPDEEEAWEAAKEEEMASMDIEEEKDDSSAAIEEEDDNSSTAEMQENAEAADTVAEDNASSVKTEKESSTDAKTENNADSTVKAEEEATADTEMNSDIENNDSSAVKTQEEPPTAIETAGNRMPSATAAPAREKRSDVSPARQVKISSYSNPSAPGTGRAWIELDMAALKSNVEYLRSLLPKGCRLMPAVKANAYGHGAVLISKELERLGIDAFCVACIDEGIELREAGIHGEILILGYTRPDQLPLLTRYELTQAVVDSSYAETLRRSGLKLHVHVAVDTGMHRLGIRCENAERISAVYKMKNLSVDGIFTHLAACDSKEPESKAFTESQIEAFRQTIEYLEAEGCDCRGRHILSSYGILNYSQAAEDYARPGIALYGVLSTEEPAPFLKPVLSLKARIASVRTLLPGESAGYGIAFTAEKKMQIAIISIGYADGLPRMLSNGNGRVLINGRVAPIIGRICMDQTIVDVSDIPHLKHSDIAVIIGKSENEEITAGQLAGQCNTITNEILSRLGARLSRISV